MAGRFWDFAPAILESMGSARVLPCARGPTEDDSPAPMGGSIRRLERPGITRQIAGRGWDVSGSFLIHRTSPSPLRGGCRPEGTTGGVMQLSTEGPPPVPAAPGHPPHKGEGWSRLRQRARRATRSMRELGGGASIADRYPVGRGGGRGVGQLASSAAISARSCSMPARVWLEVTISSGCAAGRLAMAACVAPITLSSSAFDGLSALVSTTW